MRGNGLTLNDFNVSSSSNYLQTDSSYCITGNSDSNHLSEDELEPKSLDSAQSGQIEQSPQALSFKHALEPISENSQSVKASVGSSANERQEDNQN